MLVLTQSIVPQHPSIPRNCFVTQKVVISTAYYDHGTFYRQPVAKPGTEFGSLPCLLIPLNSGGVLGIRGMQNNIVGIRYNLILKSAKLFLSIPQELPHSALRNYHWSTEVQGKVAEHFKIFCYGSTGVSLSLTLDLY